MRSKELPEVICDEGKENEKEGRYYQIFFGLIPSPAYAPESGSIRPTLWRSFSFPLFSMKASSIPGDVDLVLCDPGARRRCGGRRPSPLFPFLTMLRLGPYISAKWRQYPANRDPHSSLATMAPAWPSIKRRSSTPSKQVYSFRRSRQHIYATSYPVSAHDWRTGRSSGRSLPSQ
jgi:hypothetical protein